MMRNKFIGLIAIILASTLVNACSSAGQNNEVTRIIPQTVVVTQLVTQIVQVQITTTPMPMNTPMPPFKWPDSVTPTSSSPLITPTPGLQIADNNTRPEVEKFVSSQDIKNFLAMDFGISSLGGKVFCAYLPLGLGNDGHTIKLYLWIYCMEYPIRQGEVGNGTGLSAPVVLYVEGRFGRYYIIDARDFGENLQLPEPNIPQAIREQEERLRGSPDLNALVTEVEQEAKAYFGK